MTLTDEIQRLLPQALDVIRFLKTRPDGATIEDIMEGTGFSERTTGKSIRRLVTRYFAEMPVQGVYVLSKKGRAAAEELGDYSGPIAFGEEEADEPAPEAPARAASKPAPRIEPHPRRLTLVLPSELVIRSTAVVRAGFDAPAAGQPALRQPGRLILRLIAPHCDIIPAERPLEVPQQATAGPVQFQITPRREGLMRVRIEAFQLVEHDLRPVGGMVFELNVASFPTPRSTDFQTLAATIRLVTPPDA